MFLPKINDFANTNHLVLGDGIRHVYAVRIFLMAAHGSLNLSVQISVIQIISSDAVAIICYSARGERRSSTKFEARRRRELIVGKIVIALYLNVIDYGLLAF